MIVIKYRTIFFALIGAATLAAFAMLFVFGLNIGTDFTGGSLIEIRYAGERPANETVHSALTDAGLSSVSVRGTDDNGYIVRAAPLSEEARANLPQAIGEGATIERLTDIGPSIGTELRTKALIAISLVIACIVLYIAFVFRKVSEPISSWWYGLITIVTLVHDIIIPLGAFAVFGYLWGAQVDTLFVTAILTVLGYSVHDTIVVFDRTRENLRLNQEANRKEDFELVAGRSVEQTFTRSINTSMTTLVALTALFFLGPASTQDFALTLIVGIIAGTYSSIALATPLLVAVANWQGKKR
ncbi:MAG TPA: protein translocase subunit SecF [Candidatus Paceibacterota bacterium]|nr:protein translocase subunit SecF [Candidatus Paceibacterota bacterium]